MGAAMSIDKQALLCRTNDRAAELRREVERTQGIWVEATDKFGVGSEEEGLAFQEALAAKEEYDGFVAEVARVAARRTSIPVAVRG